jgi:hypothetical protein
VIRACVLLIAALAACTPRAESGNEAANPEVNTIVVRGSDYAFTMPDSLPAGLTTFRFTSTGKVRHELNISRLKPDVTMDSLLGTVRADRPVTNLIEGPVGVLFAEPGDSSSAGLTVELRPGERYAVICIFSDSAGARRHFDLGMYKQVTVRNEPAEPARLAADTIIATDYAFQYPRELPPGRRTFVMRNDGKQRHQFSIELLKKGVTLDSLMKVAKSGGDVYALMDGAYGLLHSRAGTQHIGGLTLDLLPDREYLIACFFRDTPQSPEHVDLGMYGVIRTTSAGAAGD